MSMAAMAVVEKRQPHFSFAEVGSQTSSEVSNLLLRAIKYCERDEAIAIDLVKRASRLLRPYYAVGGDDLSPREKAVVGGLAPWQTGRLKAYVAENLASPIAIDELSDLVKLSTSYFSTAFKVTFGMSPHNYVVSQRIDRAKHLMLNTDELLCDIALACGLADQAHLSRLFRRLTGTTPSAWRRFSGRPDFEPAQAAAY